MENLKNWNASYIPPILNGGINILKILKNKISPRGLRILKNCSFLESEDAKEWDSLAEFCTTKWMTILVKHREKKYDNLKKTVEMLSTEIINAGQKIPSPWLDILKNNTKKQENDLIYSKLGKIRRDILDYSNQKVFTWMKKPTNIPPLLEQDPFGHSIASLPPPIPLLPPRVSSQKHKIARATECPSHTGHNTQQQENTNVVIKSPKAKLLTKLNLFYNRSQPRSTNSISTPSNTVPLKTSNHKQVTEMDISVPVNQSNHGIPNITNNTIAPSADCAISLSGASISLYPVSYTPSTCSISKPITQNTVNIPFTFGCNSTLEN